METLIVLALNGLIWGLIIALIALGLSIIFGLLDVINIAHGDFFMVGSVLAWFVLQTTGNFWLALLIVPLIGFVMGSICEYLVIRPIKNAAALTIVATFGLSLFLQESVRATFGAAPKRLMVPVDQTFSLIGIEYEVYRECLEKAPGCKVVDETKDGGYITPVESSGNFVTYISRIRDDETQRNCVNMWVVSDNLLKGAALNAVQIANLLIKKYIN